MVNRVPPAGLDERQAEVLRCIVQQHIQTGEPVGSVAVAAAAGLDLSPASIRHIMAELEQRGLLSQPHTSAGRVPTNSAFRVYVDHMIGRPRMSASQAAAIERALALARGEAAEVFGEASRQLSHFSNQVGLVLAPDLQRLIVEHLEFVRLDAHRVVAILVARSGVVHHRILQLGRPYDVLELERAGRYLSEEFGGHTLPRMRQLLEARLTEERARYDRLLRRSLELGRRAVEADEFEAELFVEGTANLLNAREFADLDLLRATLATLEEKRRVVELLARVLEGGGTQVVIGEEIPVSDLAGCSLVAASYGTGERVVGTVGIVGPTRMPYAKALALVDFLAGSLTRLLSSSEN